MVDLREPSYPWVHKHSLAKQLEADPTASLDEIPGIYYILQSNTDPSLLG